MKRPSQVIEIKHCDQQWVFVCTRTPWSLEKWTYFWTNWMKASWSFTWKPLLQNPQINCFRSQWNKTLRSNITQWLERLQILKADQHSGRSPLLKYCPSSSGLQHQLQLMSTPASPEQQEPEFRLKPSHVPFVFQLLTHITRTVFPHITFSFPFFFPSTLV